MLLCSDNEVPNLVAPFRRCCSRSPGIIETLKLLRREPENVSNDNSTKRGLKKLKMATRLKT